MTGCLKHVVLLFLALPAIAVAGDYELLVFTRKGCQPCEAAKHAIADDPTLTAGYVVRMIDTQSDQQMARDYRVTSVPVFVMLRGDREIRRQTGFRGPERLREWINGKENRRRLGR